MKVSKLVSQVSFSVLLGGTIATTLAVPAHASETIYLDNGAKRGVFENAKEVGYVDYRGVDTNYKSDIDITNISFDYSNENDYKNDSSADIVLDQQIDPYQYYGDNYISLDQQSSSNYYHSNKYNSYTNYSPIIDDTGYFEGKPITPADIVLQPQATYYSSDDSDNQIIALDQISYHNNHSANYYISQSEFEQTMKEIRVSTSKILDEVYSDFETISYYEPNTYLDDSEIQIRRNSHIASLERNRDRAYHTIANIEGCNEIYPECQLTANQVSDIYQAAINEIMNNYQYYNHMGVDIIFYESVDQWFERNSNTVTLALFEFSMGEL